MAEGGGGGTDVGASLAVSSSATSGAQVTHGNKNITTGGAGKGNTQTYVVIAAISGIAIVYLVTKT